MTREIKFRGKQAYGGAGWKYGNITGSPDRPHIEEVNKIGEHSYHLPITEVVPRTVGQFTGLRDKNGKEIYEGDIIRNVKGLVKTQSGEYEDDAEVFVVKYEDAKFNVSYYAQVANSLEIIGNIHDNPELLEGDNQ